jgi:hypothetical protein
MANVYAFKDAAHYVDDSGKSFCGKPVNLAEAQVLGPRPRGVIFCGPCAAAAQARVASAPAPAPAPAKASKKK